jgi:hypothetical protein
MIALAPHARGVVLPLHVRAGGRNNALAGEHGGALRVSVTQSPEKGKANAAIVALLSEKLAIPKSRFEILSGATSAKKRVLVVDESLESLREKLEAAIDGD